jgi:hypothetical protein
MFSVVWILIAINKSRLQKSFVLNSLAIVAITGIILFSAVSINLYDDDDNKSNQAQAQLQVEPKNFSKLWETPMT